MKSRAGPRIAGMIANERPISAPHTSPGGYKGMRIFHSTELPASADIILTKFSLFDELWGNTALFHFAAFPRYRQSRSLPDLSPDPGRLSMQGLWHLDGLLELYADLCTGSCGARGDNSNKLRASRVGSPVPEQTRPKDITSSGHVGCMRLAIS